MAPMMIERNKNLQSICDAVDEVNEQFPEGQTLEKPPDTVLLEESGKLESIDLVDHLVTAEENLEETLGIP